MYSVVEDLSENKNRTNGKKSNLSCKVALSVQFSNLFLMDLKKLASLVA